MGRTPDTLVGSSSAIRAVREELRYAADSDAKILITGESGVGKEIIARLVHATSRRGTAPFVTINCAGVPESLLESELFGHARGSFTGAYRARAGLLEHADGGTIFMDEAGEMSLRMQSMLLRFLETGEIQRVGEDTPQPRTVDARIIAATNRNLVERIAGGEFREDLYYRLNVIHIYVPPLRDRPEDVEPLFRHFLQAYAAEYTAEPPVIEPDALQHLIHYEWPGNVRELRNVAERLIVRRTVGTITRAELSRVLEPRPEPAGAPPPPDIAETLFGRMVDKGESFWQVAYGPFMSRDITRDDLRRLVALGLQQTRGNYKILVRHFNMDGSDYKRFLNFLHKHGCHVRYQEFRVARTTRSLAPVA